MVTVMFVTVLAPVKFSTRDRAWDEAPSAIVSVAVGVEPATSTASMPSSDASIKLITELLIDPQVDGFSLNAWRVRALLLVYVLGIG